MPLPENNILFYWTAPKEWLFCFGWAYVARETLWFDRMHFCGAKAPLFLHAMQKT